ncbi:MAG: hypothetical protein LBP87_03365 [Planctomycetaceae bacterium]|nr:hypothetical protein [Planctomycetaceae bacterium]
MFRRKHWSVYSPTGEPVVVPDQPLRPFGEGIAYLLILNSKGSQCFAVNIGRRTRRQGTCGNSRSTVTTLRRKVCLPTIIPLAKLFTINYQLFSLCPLWLIKICGL